MALRKGVTPRISAAAASLTLFIGVGAAVQRFTKEPVDVVARLGDTVVLPCRVEDKSGELQWTKDQFGLGQTRQLPGFPRLEMVGEDPVRDWNLRITAATIEDEGMYQCQVLSSPSSSPIRSSVARLVVVIPSGPPQIVGSSPLVLVAGEEGQVSCEARGGRPAIQLEWEVGRVSVKDMSTKVEKIAGSVTYLTKTLLHIEPSWEDDGAEVKCKAFGQGGEPAGIASTTLTVQYKPQVSLRLAGNGGAVGEGDAVTAECLVEAQPPPTMLAWTLDGKLMEGKSSTVMVLPSVGRELDGTSLACKATNPLGDGTASFTLDVHYGPTMLRSPTSVSGALGSTVSLSCEAEGNPQPTYSWEAGNGRGLVGNGPNLNFTLNHASVGTYHCTATGAGGKEVVSSKASVTLASAPSLSLPSLVTGEEGGEVQLVCSVDADQLHMGLAWHRSATPLRYDEHHHIETVVDGDQITTLLTILSLQEADFGFYSCVATWEGGQVEEQVELVRGSQAELVIIQVLFTAYSLEAKFQIQVVLTSLGLLACVLCIAAAYRFGRGMQKILLEKGEGDHKEKSPIYEELNVLDQKTPLQIVIKDEKEESKESQDLVLQSINKDYAAFYGNPHLSCHLLQDEP